MPFDEEIISRDYYPPTKLIGFLSDFIVKASNGRVKNIILLRFISALCIFGFLAFGVPLIVGYITNDFFFTSWELVLAFFWLFIAALLLDLFEYAIDDFWIKFKKIVKMPEEDFKNFKEEYNKKIFSKNYLIFSVIMYVVAFIYMPDILKEYGLAILITVDLLMIPAAIMWGAFIYLTFYMHFFSYEICKKDIDINPFHPDGFGGLGGLGKLPLKTASFASSASLYIPYAINRSRAFGAETVVGATMILFVLVVSFVILLTFLIPLFPVHRLAREAKYDLLLKVGNRLRARLDAFEKADLRMEKDMELMVASYNYTAIKDMKVWPFNTRTLFEITSYIILPVALFLAGIWVQ